MSKIGSKLAASVRQAKDQINDAPEQETKATPAPTAASEQKPAETKATKKKEVEKLVSLAASRRVWPD